MPVLSSPPMLGLIPCKYVDMRFILNTRHIVQSISDEDSIIRFDTIYRRVTDGQTEMQQYSAQHCGAQQKQYVLREFGWLAGNDYRLAQTIEHSAFRLF